ncbi:MAG: Glyoxylate reductase [Parcubacteria group bacterium GW2011_GWC2_38_7]|nr:MAG: Glyoxylate reductase [Parcubacteria group bacterium GW2011_GWC2_38_7]
MNKEQKKFYKVVILDTVIFYPEHEKLLKQLVEKPKIERVPLEYNQTSKEWELPDGYLMPEDASIIIWPSSLPESFNGISVEVHEKLKTGYCYVEQGLRDNIPAQNLLNRVKDADCIITCWTAIPDEVLERINPKAILTWTHEYEHRLNVKLANKKGIFTACVNDYGTGAVAELEINMLLELIKRNKKTDLKFENEHDIAIGVLMELFCHYRKSYVNEKNTRRGKFSHQFHKMGRSLKYYGDLNGKDLDEVIPYKSIEGKRIGFVTKSKQVDYLVNVLRNGFNATVSILENLDTNNADFYKIISLNDFVVYDSSEIDQLAVAKIIMIGRDRSIDIQSLKHYDEILKNKTVGIVGLGRIGSRVAKLACSFGMNVIYSGNKKEELKYQHVELDQLLKNSDIISVNIKAHVENNLISKEKFDLIKKDAYFINTSDANAVDQASLTKRMLANDLYVGLDVYQGLPTTKTLLLDDDLNGKIKDQLANHVITYRAGWATQESIKVKTYKLLGHMITVLSKMEP